ncbi:MAG: dynein regulation protein LC7 [Hydrococcus sp. C42_A2020_068]|nr:dynein regulation protein LC7 [Hydrococcus sp. C42_A2020_068]
MPLLVGQIVYTSFPGIGFKSLVSQQIPLDIQQAFIQQVVYKHWDTYNPPKAGYKATYLYQFSTDRTLFGWLYNEGTDELGRSNIPYCIGYYLAGLLSTVQLENILTCLDIGPVTSIDRHNPPASLENIIIPDLCNYQPARSGVAISSDIRKQTHKDLLQKKLLNLFVSCDEMEKAASRDRAINREASLPIKALSPASSELDLVDRQSMNPSNIERILQELMAKPIGIQGVALVSAEGQPIIPTIGMDKNSSLIMAGSMLYLAKSTQDEFHWQGIETIAVRAQEGHVILAYCHPDVFLLVKAGKALSGLLDGEINRTVEKLRVALQPLQDSPVRAQPEALPQLPSEVLPKIDEVLYEFNAEASPANDDEIRYRGRRTNL